MEQESFQSEDAFEVRPDDIIEKREFQNAAGESREDEVVIRKRILPSGDTTMYFKKPGSEHEKEEKEEGMAAAA